MEKFSEGGVGRVYYILYYVVIRIDKLIIKFRVVYDVFVKFDGVVLNDCVYIGLFFVENIFDVFLRFCVN